MISLVTTLDRAEFEEADDSYRFDARFAAATHHLLVNHFPDYARKVII
jgi:hypothetical protein